MNQHAVSPSILTTNPIVDLSDSLVHNPGPYVSGHEAGLPLLVMSVIFQIHFIANFPNWDSCRSHSSFDVLEASLTQSFPNELVSTRKGFRVVEQVVTIDST